MKIIQLIKEDILPFNKKHNTVLVIIIACVFQFVLFFAPVLADEAVEQAKAETNNNEIANIEEEIITISLVKDQNSSETPLAVGQVIAFTSQEVVASSTPEKTPVKEIKVIRTSTHTITAYNSEPNQTDGDPCTTANGYNVCKAGREDTIAANFLKFGTKVMIPELFGDRVFVVRDRMNKRHANRVDVWMKDYDDAVHFGVKVAKIQVIE
jgi:3D (Asp-Asp-Asp) domain-containing protein